MANQNTLFDLSVTPGSNLNIKGQSQQGTAPGSTIDNIFQRYGAALKAFYDSLGGVATVSGTDTYTVTVTEDWAALASGLVLVIKVANANTGAATLNVTVTTAGALGAKAIRRQGDTALSAGDMVAKGVYLLRYDSTFNSSAGAWILLNPAAGSITTITQPTLTLKQGTAPTPTAEGDIQWDTDDDAIIVGDGAAQASFYKAASASDMEAGTAKRSVTADLAQRHQSAAKVWCSAGVTGNLLSSYNMTSLTDNGTGDITFTIATDFSSADYCAVISTYLSAASAWPQFISSTAKAAGVIRGGNFNQSGTALDPTQWHFVAFGDQ